MRFTTLDTPAGALVIAGEEVVAGLWFARPVPDTWVRDDGPFADAVVQLGEWFAGARRSLTFACEPRGTAFQHRVWSALRAIPYGSTRTYGVLARELGTSPRAVGRANGSNPLSVVIPCHRLVGTDGALRGYLGGTEIKRWLLDHERAVVAGMVGSSSLQTAG